MAAGKGVVGSELKSREHVEPAVCVLVLNYNGKAHLDDCLTSALASARSYDGLCAVVCVDNKSTDGSREYVRERFADVELVEAPRNDFLFSLNAVIEARREEIVIVVNNDMRFAADFVAFLVGHFEDPDVGAVGAAILTWDGSADTVGPRCARLDHWWFYKWWRYDCQQPALTLEACGGAVAYRRSMFVALGGFDRLYRPGYYEDLDVSYRAWARGWKVVYEPRSRAFHKESVSMLERFGDAAKARILYRNHLLFTTKNVGGWRFLIGFLALLPLRALRPLLTGDRVPLGGFVRALPSLPAALLRRMRAREPILDLQQFNNVTCLTPGAVPPALKTEDWAPTAEERA
jgi:GT2 family glycosyltransferase